MRAAVLREGSIIVRDDVPEPVPAAGQVLVQVKACGICGSDLHFAKHGGTMMALTQRDDGVLAAGDGPRSSTSTATSSWATSSPAEVLEVGPDTEAPAPGTHRHVDPDPADG